MNTPAHVIFGLSLLGHTNAIRYSMAIAVGAILPDVLMMVFYAYQKFQGVPEEVIWNEKYFLVSWQNSFDLMNSIPLLAALALISGLTKNYSLSMLFASTVIHCLLDLPVHHDDGHRHFFPLSDFRFESPLSYWDPNHYGNIVSMMEVILVMLGGVYLWRAEQGILRRVTSLSRLRVVVLVMLIIYGLFFLFVVRTWLAAK
ncbi:MAG: hypothetical protein GKR96_04165 [Gammaproteobacteria bacterium]|nr:hypothetical protein [Gammaproteobacteria bacterium]